MAWDQPLTLTMILEVSRAVKWRSITHAHDRSMRQAPACCLRPTQHPPSPTGSSCSPSWPKRISCLSKALMNMLDAAECAVAKIDVFDHSCFRLGTSSPRSDPRAPALSAEGTTPATCWRDMPPSGAESPNGDIGSLERRVYLFFFFKVPISLVRSHYVTWLHSPALALRSVSDRLSHLHGPMSHGQNMSVGHCI